MKQWLSVILVLCCSGMGLAQLKYEREYRVDTSKVPRTALSFVEGLDFPGKIKWYVEEGLERTSYEAKGYRGDNLYSIEFDRSGKLEDIEVKVDWQELEDSTFKQVAAYLDDNYDKVKVRKAQLQYTGPLEDLTKMVLSSSVPETITTRFELVARVKEEKGRKQYEFLFTPEGKLLHKARIVQKNTDNLEY